ncbi:anti-sigma-I factor RsgI family protein [Clostridium cellulovorans]|uniref:Anti-sigma factor RsgI-like middle domain-containing protein n=1 Tax=Clostridium cellulovorans (strain ATCC 35296 / DSM 3052 / OCM 3 / 743B) TaxID=573061 RepID=D9SM62_CLOC7|nr:hypothetical protein [Clostridium cellulovorans]ADL51793.1 hypothetical protein Clocel_2050 [Clostridium cellulovorans 743B]
MNNNIKSALDKIKAEEELIKKTEEFLKSNIKLKNYNNQMTMKRGGIFDMKKITIAACLALLVGGLSYGGYSYYNDKTPVAYLSLDINPSIELAINDSNEVVSATAYNGDGETVLEGVDVVNMEVKDAVNELVVSASDNGFIADDGSTIISVTSETDDTTLGEELTNEAEVAVEEAITETEDTAVVYKDNVALARRDEARELGITPGKLNLIQKLMALDPTITVEDYKETKVTNIMKKVVELKKSQKGSSDATVEESTELSEVSDEIETAVAKVEENYNKKTNKKIETNSGEEMEKSSDDTAATDLNDKAKKDKVKENNIKQEKNNTEVVSPTEQPEDNTPIGEQVDKSKGKKAEEAAPVVEGTEPELTVDKPQASGEIEKGKAKENNGVTNGKVSDTQAATNKNKK